MARRRSRSDSKRRDSSNRARTRGTRRTSRQRLRFEPIGNDRRYYTPHEIPRTPYHTYNFDEVNTRQKTSPKTKKARRDAAEPIEGKHYSPRMAFVDLAVPICRRRRIRKEVLHAIRKTGSKVPQKKPLITPISKIVCKKR